ncbi:MAG TPA: efflux RND transporter periplasmic adaptor subunit [Beijerinckiaceae bacterium]|nr:efflux RND transporter periplasmic adaptor subunit [Beijerinckiaceae bacterium]
MNAATVSVPLAGQANIPPTALPRLRAELEFSEAAPDRLGQPGLLIVDPARNAYFQLAWPASAIVRLWRPIAAAELATDLERQLGLSVSAADIGAVTEFLYRNELTEADRSQSWRGLAAQREARASHPLIAAMQSFLFLRLPLFNPETLLGWMTPRLAPLFSSGFLVACAGALLVAGYLIARQWSAFTGDLSQLFRLDALPIYALVLFGMKIVHEFGHAVVAHRAGCRVPTMGLALMLGVPVLYTDTTDSWRLTRRRQRLAIVLAGVGAEAILAVLALLMWPFLPEGTMRLMAVAVATMAVTTSVLINLNPCMRFDGYFALSDLLNVPNLQDRSFALTRDHLRDLLLGAPRAPAPDLSDALRRALVVFGYVTWIYRLGLYLGIAALVYALSFKLLGIVLFLFEILYFVVRPVVREVADWWTMRERLSTQRIRAFAAGLGLLCCLAVVPWNRIVEAHAVLSARNDLPVHARSPARIADLMVADGDVVVEGQMLARLESPLLMTQVRRIDAEIQALELRLSRAPALDSDRDALPVLETQLRSAREKRAALGRLAQDLEIRAPASGTVVDLDPGLALGVWVSPAQELARIVADRGVRAYALTEEIDARRLQVGANAVFVSETGLRRPVSLKVTSVAEATEASLGEPVLIDRHGGPIAVTEDRRKAVPRQALVAIALEGEGAAPLLLDRGTIRIAAAGENPAARILRRIGQVLQREGGF